jgi:hypothetical protein
MNYRPIPQMFRKKRAYGKGELSILLLMSLEANNHVGARSNSGTRLTMKPLTVITVAGNRSPAYLHRLTSTGWIVLLACSSPSGVVRD